MSTRRCTLSDAQEFLAKVKRDQAKVRALLSPPKELPTSGSGSGSGSASTRPHTFDDTLLQLQQYRGLRRFSQQRKERRYSKGSLSRGGNPSFPWLCSGPASPMAAKQKYRAARLATLGFPPSACEQALMASGGVLGDAVSRLLQAYPKGDVGRALVYSLLQLIESSEVKLSKTAASMQMMYMPTRKRSTGDGGSQPGSPAIRRRSSMENTREMLHMLFRRYDIDHSGGISPDELLQLTREMGVEMTVEEVREAILQMDSSKDGVVQFDEFAAWYDSIGGTGVAGDGDGNGGEGNNSGAGAGALRGLVRGTLNATFGTLGEGGDAPPFPVRGPPSSAGPILSRRLGSPSPSRSRGRMRSRGSDHSTGSFDDPSGGRGGVGVGSGSGRGGDGGGFEEGRIGHSRSFSGSELVVLSEEDVVALFRRAVTKARELVGSDRGSLFLIDHRKQTLWTKVATEVGLTISVPITAGVVGAVVRSGKTLVVPDAYTEEHFNQSVDKTTGYRTRNILCVPIFREGCTEMVGVLQAINKLTEHDSTNVVQDGAFTAEDVAALEHYASDISVGVENLALRNQTLSILPETPTTPTTEAVARQMSSVGEEPLDVLGALQGGGVNIDTAGAGAAAAHSSGEATAAGATRAPSSGATTEYSDSDEYWKESNSTTAAGSGGGAAAGMVVGGMFGHHHDPLARRKDIAKGWRSGTKLGDADMLEYKEKQQQLLSPRSALAAAQLREVADTNASLRHFLDKHRHEAEQDMDEITDTAVMDIINAAAENDDVGMSMELTTKNIQNEWNRKTQQDLQVRIRARAERLNASIRAAARAAAEEEEKKGGKSASTTMLGDAYRVPRTRTTYAPNDSNTRSISPVRGTGHAAVAAAARKRAAQQSEAALLLQGNKWRNALRKCRVQVPCPPYGSGSTGAKLDMYGRVFGRFDISQMNEDSLREEQSRGTGYGEDSEYYEGGGGDEREGATRGDQAMPLTAVYEITPKNRRVSATPFSTPKNQNNSLPQWGGKTPTNRERGEASGSMDSMDTGGSLESARVARWRAAHMATLTPGERLNVSIMEYHGIDASAGAPPPPTHGGGGEGGWGEEGGESSAPEALAQRDTPRTVEEGAAGGVQLAPLHVTEEAHREVCGSQDPCEACTAGAQTRGRRQRHSQRPTRGAQCWRGGAESPKNETRRWGSCSDASGWWWGLQAAAVD